MSICISVKCQAGKSYEQLCCFKIAGISPDLCGNSYEEVGVGVGANITIVLTLSCFSPGLGRIG